MQGTTKTLERRGDEHTHESTWTNIDRLRRSILCGNVRKEKYINLIKAAANLIFVTNCPDKSIFII